MFNLLYLRQHILWLHMFVHSCSTFSNSYFCIHPSIPSSLSLRYGIIWKWIRWFKLFEFFQEIFSRYSMENTKVMRIVTSILKFEWNSIIIVKIDNSTQIWVRIIRIWVDPPIFVFSSPQTKTGNETKTSAEPVEPRNLPESSSHRSVSQKSVPLKCHSFSLVRWSDVWGM